MIVEGSTSRHNFGHYQDHSLKDRAKTKKSKILWHKFMASCLRHRQPWRSNVTSTCIENVLALLMSWPLMLHGHAYKRTNG